MTNQAASELGKLGGVARRQALSPERRKQIASFAAKTRWGSQKSKKR